MIYRKYSNVWLAFINLKAKNNFKFEDLIDLEEEANSLNYKGAWANILIKAKSIQEALQIIPLGLDELNFEVVFIDKIENMESLIDSNEINDKLFPY